MGAHGVHGAVRARLFTPSPERLPSYTTLGDESGGRLLRIKQLDVAPLPTGAEADGPTLARMRIEGTNSREAAQALKGIFLCVNRDELPDVASDEFYHADLLGCSVTTTAGLSLGHIVSVDNYGAQDVLEVVNHDSDPQDPGHGPTSCLLPLTIEAVPLIDLAAGRILVDDSFVIAMPGKVSKPRAAKLTQPTPEPRSKPS